MERDIPPTAEQAELRKNIDIMFERSDLEVFRILSKYLTQIRKEESCDG